MLRTFGIIVAGLLGLLVLFSGVVLALSYYWATPDNLRQHEDAVVLIAELGSEVNHDFGQIDRRKGNFIQRYTLTNSGSEPITIVDASTSCGCTTIEVDGVWYGMHSLRGPTLPIPSGGSSDVVVQFDPNTHGPFGLGKFMRVITLTSETGVETLLTFSGEVVEGDVSESEEDVSSLSGIFQFEETAFDFGVIKQSGGIVEHAFSFIYDGEHPITITGTPTSCGCTTAVTDKMVYDPGDKGTLTVFFNPNLHEEPLGRFYKTVSILTDPRLPVDPELKVWQEIDLDLGEDAYELQDHRDE